MPIALAKFWLPRSSNGRPPGVKVNITFAQGASLSDPAKLFNVSLDAGTCRAIDVREGYKVHEGAFGAVIEEAGARNSA